jgi:hypothetical protein
LLTQEEYSGNVLNAKERDLVACDYVYNAKAIANMITFYSIYYDPFKITPIIFGGCILLNAELIQRKIMVNVEY